MMLDHLGEHDAAKAIVKAIETVLAQEKLRTRDLKGPAEHGHVRQGGGRRADVARHSGAPRSGEPGIQSQARSSGFGFRVRADARPE